MKAPPNALQLSRLNEAELQRESTGPFAKWSTMCVLRQAGLQTLDALLLLPGMSPEVVARSATALAAQLGVGALLVRSDGGAETRNYYVGGSSFPTAKAIEESVGLLMDGRAVILTPPTNRFSNRLSANLRLVRSGEFVIEMLGPGYDISDLNRGGLTPEVVVSVAGVDWDLYQDLTASAVKVWRDTDAESCTLRRNMRLARVAARFLPRILDTKEELSIGYATDWLEQKGYGYLGNSWFAPTSLREIRRLYDAAWFAGRLFPQRQWGVLCISASKLDELVPWTYWDIVNGSSKFG